MKAEIALAADDYTGINFRAPKDLEIVPPKFRNVLVIGQCLVENWTREFQRVAPSAKFQHILFNNSAQLPEQPPLPPGEYDLQILSIPLRGVLNESMYLRLSYLEEDATKAVFEKACERLTMLLRAGMRWNKDHNILSFVANFLVPQQNPDGRLLPKYTLRNLGYFVERLNEYLCREIETYRSAFLLDIDQISASLGRRYLQDDSVCVTAHGSVLNKFDFGLDKNRIEAPRMSVPQLYKSKEIAFVREIWRETEAMFKTIHQLDAVKMVIIDLDDTLWRGILAEEEQIRANALEGWPMGVVEALSFLKRRGIILAIASKNEEKNVIKIFSKILQNRLPLEEFAIRRINWNSKIDNIAEIINLTNLLPKNVVFVDDNPLERAAIASAFPGIRVIGNDPYSIKRILLWAPETQVARVTAESSQRNTMIQAQVDREVARKELTREEFLNSLGVSVDLFEINSTEDALFGRAFELLNKTNQFNTTGRRWRLEEIADQFRNGLKLVCFSVRDRFVEYGLVGVVLLRGAEIKQFVMSCRVFGMGVELAAITKLCEQLQLAGHDEVEACLLETAANFPCRDVWRKMGFLDTEGKWILSLSTLPRCPTHISFSSGC